MNVFQAGQTYNLFFVYGTPDIEQTYQMYVGPGLNWDPVKKTSTNVKLIRASIVSVPFVITPGTGGDANTLKLDYDGNILTATINLSAYAGDYATAAQDLCLPSSFCTYDTTAKKCKGAGAGMGTLFPSLTQDEQDLACTYAGKDIDCPTGGCVGFSVTLPTGFVAQDQTTTDNLLAPQLACFPEDTNWNIFPAAALPNLAGSCARCTAQPRFLSGHRDRTFRSKWVILRCPTSGAASGITSAQFAAANRVRVDERRLNLRALAPIHCCRSPGSANKVA